MISGGVVDSEGKPAANVLDEGRFTVVKDFVAESGETADHGDLVVDVQGD